MPVQFAAVVGGVRCREPASDLAVCAAVLSSLLDVPIPKSSVFFGEVGLTGQLRPVPNLAKRVRDVVAMGFKR